MKAVVVEIKNNKAAVLSDDGCVVTVKNNSYEIGQVIQLNPTKHQFSKKIAVFAASAAAFVMLGTGTWAYATPYSYISVDVNPSIEYTINRFDRVLSVKAVNDDGDEILKEISLEDLKNQKIETAILKTVEHFTAARYFETSEGGGIVITTASRNANKADELATDLQEAVTDDIAETEEDVIVEAYSVGLERVTKAKELGVTPGKLNLVEKLQESSTDPDTINFEEWLDRPVKEIMKATKENRKASATSGSAITKDRTDTDKKAKEQAKNDKRKERSEEKQQKKQEKKQEKEKRKLEKGQRDKASEQSFRSKEASKAIEKRDEWSKVFDKWINRSNAFDKKDDKPNSGNKKDDKSNAGNKKDDKSNAGNKKDDKSNAGNKKDDKSNTDNKKEPAAKFKENNNKNEHAIKSDQRGSEQKATDAKQVEKSKNGKANSGKGGGRK
jgi:hypothetical protein